MTNARFNGSFLPGKLYRHDVDPVRSRDEEIVRLGIGLDRPQVLEQSYRRHVTQMLPSDWCAVNFTSEGFEDDRSVRNSCMIQTSPCTELWCYA